MVIADMGSVRPGVPTLTVALRGMANVTVEARTLASAKHSGQYGGAAPDALLALIRALSTLHDDDGNVAVEGLAARSGPAAARRSEEFRALAEVVDDQPLIGTGSLGSRVWSGPAITVIGIDAPSVDGALNAVPPHARAMMNVRVHPEQDADEAQGAVIKHLERRCPSASRSPSGRPHRQRFRRATQQRRLRGGGGLVGSVGRRDGHRGQRRLDTARELASSGGHPSADIVLGGATDGFANIHGPNERVLLDEFEKTTLAIADFFGRLARGITRGAA